jgi:hypothetical protein
MGNREYYMNCADVRIISNNCGSFTGPRLFVAQVPPSSITIPEWSVDNDYRSVLLNNRPPVTVSGSCDGSEPPAPPPSPPSPPPAPIPPPSPPVVPPPAPPSGNKIVTTKRGVKRRTTKRIKRKTTKKGAAAPTNNASIGACTAANQGAQVCPSANSQNFSWCVNGRWVSQLCGTGTVCKATSRNTIVCDWPTKKMS